MSHSTVHPAPVRSGHVRSWIVILAVAAVGIPGFVLRLTGTHPDAVIGAVIFGLAVLSAAFLLSWAAETAEVDISQGLALAVIAFIAILPEYAVDAVLAFRAGEDPEVAKEGLAIANMTGGNRLLIGLAWPIVFFIFFYRTKLRTLIVDRERSLELAFLAIATAYVIFIPLRDHITLVDSIILISLFGCYLFYTSKLESEEVELVGPARALGSLSTVRRRGSVVALLIFAAVVVFAAAEPFAESLIEIGEEFGVSEFFLIQWLAPLASEAPEVLVASLLAWRGRAAVGMGALISSKVNQWTLLIGTLPIAFMLGAGEFQWSTGLPLNTVQRDEIFLTAAQSAFAIAVFANLRMTYKEALALLILFATQLFITVESVRVIYAIGYTVLCAGLLLVNRGEVGDTARSAWTLLRGRKLEHDEELEAAPGRG
jgi:cation:H+ antiporter